MAQNESQANKAKESPNLTPPEFAAMGKKQLEELAATQKDLMAKFQDANKIWFDRMQTEAKLASEFTAKLTAARSMPEVAAAYQEWAQRHMEMAAEDAKRMFADGQKLAETGARLMSSGWKPNGHGSGGST
jgi:hypothetical protein